ncbi:hypothetical protein SD10_08010 [Spirosoma radiotolerans]|uniref:3-keto-disaccharide hydrolase domain-containing protein n=2 Tax=Spirosoma radiotolerans TaxID=1379870 RepID=A0A0E4A111_9BACT|nr:hypothetical protein SD10_08010 [Spirosoma radiotolerans]
MYRLYFLLFMLPLAWPAYAQKTSVRKSQELRIPMTAGKWTYAPGQVDFIAGKEAGVMKILKGPKSIVLNDVVFSNGTIEYDVELTGPGFPGINFRMDADQQNGENFYLRSFGKVTPDVRTTVQYAPIVKGMSMWDLTDEYQTGASIAEAGWNHVKLVISGRQMKAYVNDMSKPVLVVPELESPETGGSISLSGSVNYANLVIKPDVTEGLNPEPGYNIVAHDTRYLRNWLVSAPAVLPFGKEPVIGLQSTYGKTDPAELPDSSTRWSPIKAESRGIVNLSRQYAHKPGEVRLLAWLKTSIQSNKAQERLLSLGFSDEVWVFVNGQFLYADKNYFGTPQQKYPAGRCTIENASIRLPLKEGNNEILIGLANYFYGWGIVARLDDTVGIQIMK